MSSRPAIPNRTKRKVRQRCGFGCIVCGLPIYEYDHMPGYAKVKRHKADELTLLCPNHHSMKTKKLISDEEIYIANKNPHNLQKGSTTPFQMGFNGQSPTIMLGTQTFLCSDTRRPAVFAPIMIDKHVLFGFTIDTNGLLLNMEARDSNNKTVLLIKNSELILSSGVWDASFVGNTLKIQEGHGKYIVELSFNPPDKFIIKRYKLTFSGTTVEILPKEIRFRGRDIPNFKLLGDGIIDANIGILVGQAPNGLGVGIKVGN